MQKRENVYINTSTILTQGSILNHCIASDVPDNLNVWGCVITPRCDIDHQKVSTIHYLPVIDFEFWVNYFAKQLLFMDFLKVLKTQIENVLKSIDIQEDLISAGYSCQDIINVINNSNLTASQKKNAINKVNTYFNSTDSEFKNHIKSGKHKKFIERLISGDLHQFYLIEDWKNPTQFKVVLLRDVRHINISVALNFRRGFYPEEYSTEERKLNNLSVVDDDIYYIEAVLNSPYLEHLMQAFSYNFTRIGVPDMPLDHVKQHLIDLITNILS